MVEVIQADRDAASAFLMKLDRKYGPHPDLAREGYADGSEIVQAFARHRLSHSTPGDAEVRKAGRFTIEDDTFVEVRGLVSGHVYLWQTAPDTGEEAQINLSPQGAARLAQELAARIATPSGRAQTPKGWQLVPIELTQAMLDATCCDEADDKQMRETWKALLYAAPPAQDQTKGDE